jgi:hypothetical protein
MVTPIEPGDHFDGGGAIGCWNAVSGAVGLGIVVEFGRIDNSMWLLCGSSVVWLAKIF